MLLCEAAPAKQIENTELREWAKVATEGFVLCSFGSVVSRLPDAQIVKLFEFFQKLGLPVVMR